MKLSEIPDKKPQKTKTINVQYIRTTLDGTKVYNTITGKRTYLLWDDGRWTTCMGTNPLPHEFTIIN